MAAETLAWESPVQSTGDDDNNLNTPPAELFLADGDGDDYIQQGIDRLAIHANAIGMPAQQQEHTALQPGRGYSLEQIGHRHVQPSRIAGPAVAQLFSLHELSRTNNWSSRDRDRLGAIAGKANFQIF